MRNELKLIKFTITMLAGTTILLLFQMDRAVASIFGAWGGLITAITLVLVIPLAVAAFDEERNELITRKKVEPRHYYAAQPTLSASNYVSEMTVIATAHQRIPAQAASKEE
ncbi:MAG: hypothetical protein DRJ46_03650 [Thermoprotei archaeon]|nr:MAG: hypothetical protein DRJ46_03650 [Thermoprotei archaeon]HDJ97361.1 hypothetical protein [Thermofilum sp.]